VPGTEGFSAARAVIETIAGAITVAIMIPITANNQIVFNPNLLMKVPPPKSATYALSSRPAAVSPDLYFITKLHQSDPAALLS